MARRVSYSRVLRSPLHRDGAKGFRKAVETECAGWRPPPRAQRGHAHPQGQLAVASKRTGGLRKIVPGRRESVSSAGTGKPRPPPGDRVASNASRSTVLSAVGRLAGLDPNLQQQNLRRAVKGCLKGLIHPPQRVRQVREHFIKRGTRS